MREGWISDNLSNCVKLKSGDGLTAKKMIPGVFPVYGGNGIAGYHNEYNLKGKNIIIGRVGALCGNARFVDDKLWVTDNAFKISEFKYEFELKFLKYLLNHLNLRSYARQSAQPVISNSSLKDVILTFPKSLSEQKQIVAILDKAFAAIDQAIANTEKNTQNAKDLFQSKLNAIFSQTGEGWEEKRLSDIGIVQTGTTPPTKDKTNYGDYMPFVKPPHFKSDGSIDSKKSMLSKKGLVKGRLIDKNSILMVCIGATIGKTGFTTIPVSANQQINALTPSDNYIPKLLYFCLISPYAQNQVLLSGSSAQATLPIMNKSKWLKLKVNLPSENTEQSRIVRLLNNLNLECNNAELKYERKITNLVELKKSILQKAFTGELTRKVGLPTNSV